MATAPAPTQRLRWLWRALALASCALFVASVAQYYHPQFGFSAFLLLTAEDENYQLPVLRTIPHFQYPRGEAYDGGQYAQLAMVPLLRDPAIDRALDAPAYRARRILFSWTAWAAGMGRPAWILQAYALQNVVCWFLLAWVITRWIPPISARFFALWFGAMFSHGLLMSVRLAVLDGPSLLLLTAVVIAAERGRTWLTAAAVGISGLGRETNLLGAITLPWPSGWRGWLRAAGAAALVILPFLVWQDYVWSIYRGSAAEGADHITIPFSAFATKWQDMIRNPHGLDRVSVLREMLVAFALTAQAAYILWRRAWTSPWWRLAAAYAVLMVVVHWVVWEGHPGAITRVMLPLKFGFNVLLARETRGFWAWLVAGNLDLAMSDRVF